jgi:kanamycin kinase
VTGPQDSGAPDTSRQWSLEGVEVPAIARELAHGAEPELAWRNELDGLTFRVRDGFLKWNPDGNEIDLAREIPRLRWLEGRHPAPRVLADGHDGRGRWMLTAPLDGDSAVAPRWVARPETAVVAIAEGLRRMHALPVDEFPAELRGAAWAEREPVGFGPRPPIDEPVVVHGDACAPNTLVGADGRWAGNVDMGDLGVGDRWADLAVATMSLDWNYTPALEALFYATYGIEPDEERIRYYRALWNLES